MNETRGDRTRADSVAGGETGGASSSGRAGPDPPPSGGSRDFGIAEERDAGDSAGDGTGDLDIAALLSRADGAVHQAFVSLLGGDLDARVPARRPPRLGAMVEIAGPCPELNWHQATRTDAQREDLVRSLSTGRFREPVILRGAADEWPAVCDASRAWTLSRLVADHGSFVGDVRERSPRGSAANGVPKDAYAYVEEAHEAVRAGKFAAPSRTVKMSLRDAAARMVRNGDGEGGVYVQAELSRRLAIEAGLRTNDEKGEKNEEGDANPGVPMEPWRSMDAAGWRETQPARLWLSAAGSVSPLHFDSSASTLSQVTGTKRMLLYPPSTLARAHLYPNWHPLRRRSKVRLDADVASDVAKRAFPRWTGSRFGADDVDGDADAASDATSDATSSPARQTASPPGAWEAVLGPGDVLVFPPRWAHYTESLGPETCASVTRRFKTPGFTDASDFADAFSHPTPRTLDWPEGVTPESLERGARFARWMERRGLVDVGYGDDDDVDVNGRRFSSEGRRALRLLETAGVVRPIGVPLRLDASGAVRPECCAMGKATSARRRAGGDGGAKGRGGAAQWAAQWWAAATDAATVVAETFDGDQKFASAVQHSTESPVVGVYARGSVARGEARAGVSDVDLVTVCWGHDTADGVRDMARLKHRLRARLNSTGGSVRATGGGSPGTRAPNEARGTPDASSGGEDSGEEDSWLGRWGHLATKADVRVVTVPPPPHPAGVALAAAIAGEPMARQPPDAVEALAQCLGDETMFVLAVECAPITGPDLPALLPASARHPPPARCLETLNADVVDALADGGERALTWALKRCVRAAFERETLSTRRTRATGDNVTGDDIAGASADDRENADGRGAIGRVYTRDLYYCAGLASDARPELGEDLAAALCASVHGPRAVWGALWYACGSALCVRLRDAIAYGQFGPR